MSECCHNKRVNVDTHENIQKSDEDEHNANGGRDNDCIHS